MAGAGRSWQYIGGKTLLFPDVAELEKKNAETGLKQVEDYLRRIMAILDELNRRQWEQERDIIESVATGRLYLATMVDTNAKGTGWYNCTMQKFEKDGTLTSVGNGVVYNLVDRYSDDEGLKAGETIVCHKISEEDDDVDYYAGSETYGRSIIGLCS